MGLIIILNSLGAFAEPEIKNKDYYNEINFNLPYLSTLKALLIEPDKTFTQTEGHINLYPERSNCTALKNAGFETQDISYKFKIQPNPSAPLMFVIPGTGGNSDSKMVQYFAMLAYQAGYSVVELISTTNYAFGLAASKSGRTGFLPDDAKNYYTLLKNIIQKITNHQIQNTNKKLDPRSYHLMGYSYGGLDIGFILKEDLNQKYFNFTSAILLNTPLSRKYAISRVDSYNESFQFDRQLSKDLSDIQDSIHNGISDPIGSIYGDLSRLLQTRNDYFEELWVGLENRRITVPDLPGRLEDFAPISSNQGGKVIAAAFRSDVKMSAYAGDLIRYCNIKNNNPQIDIDLPNPKNALPQSIAYYLENSPIWEAAIHGYSELSRAGKTPKMFDNILFLKVIEQKKQESELDYAIEYLHKYSKQPPKIMIFHAGDDYLTFGQKSPANNLINRWIGFSPQFVELKNLSQSGGHMGQFVDQKIIKQLLQTLIELIN
jgi:hypothetical protein